ncbi:unnamed protein product [Vicia faba]|uniref:RING-type domain-containing protein n=1 Tax=Vicia faba TaxID=3906 RepID=A0AAV0YZ31_VICFA|nr:unnamed protein product [Vicia faba]
MMSPLIRIALAINLICNNHTVKILMKYSTHLHIFLKWIFNIFSYYLSYPLCKFQCFHGVSKYVNESQEDVDCAVCLSKVKEKEEISELQCKHVFHKDCLETWISFKCYNTTCPICRVSVGLVREMDDQWFNEEDFQISWLR